MLFRDFQELDSNLCFCFRRKRKIEFENQSLDDSFEAFSHRKRRYVEEPKFGRPVSFLDNFLEKLFLFILDVFLNPEKKGQQVFIIFIF